MGQFCFIMVGLFYFIIDRCALAVRVSFFRPTPLTEEKVKTMIETSIENRVTEERILEIIKEKIPEIKPVAPEEKVPE